jgi:hypothetical protein
MEHCCTTPECADKAHGRKLFCLKCWCQIPESLQRDIRKDTEKGEHTLRAHPARDWLNAAFRHTVKKGN